ncbi:MAG: toprim domain-containing protein [Xanthobacteraceae bacterium]|nr:toprim domain-containing protein [Xanthobacteraceae bacterium]
MASYGIELRRSGVALVGRCPFHTDGGRPNLHVYRSGRWICYRCGEAGDVIEFVRRIENISFRDAVDRLQGSGHQPPAHTRPVKKTLPRKRVRNTAGFSVEESQVLGAAIKLYANTMMSEAVALEYMSGRGFPPRVVEQYHIGFARGEELITYLRWRRLPVNAAIRIGLLTRDRQEVMAGRITIPEFDQGRPVWLMGRRLLEHDETLEATPKYLGLPGPKPLLGWEEVRHNTRSVCVVEGPLDLLTLRMWDVPALALAGSYASEHNLRLLERFELLYLALDRDDGGRKATAALVSRFGSRAVPIALPPGVKDPADLAGRLEGERLFRSAIRAADAECRLAA